jgi:hypothetical protein
MVLYKVVSRWLPRFIEKTEAAGGLPPFVERAFRAYVDCGRLEGGFGRIWCPHCGDDLLVAFSCKTRGLCPSCGARRMMDTAAHLVDRVIPRVPVRQWVLTFPFELRAMVAYDARLAAAVRRVFLREVERHYRRTAREQGIRGGRTGSVTVAQRFGSALNLNLHLHSIFLDGVYHRRTPTSTPVFVASPELDDQAVASVLDQVRRKVAQVFVARGLLEADASDDSESGTLAQLAIASVMGSGALGGPPSRSPAPSVEPKEGRRAEKPSPLCAAAAGFTLHARTRVQRHRRGDLEVLCRYVARPPLADDQLELRDDGKVALTFSRRWSDGTTSMAFEPLVFMARLAALIPLPHLNGVYYSGVLASNSKWRKAIVGKAVGGLRRPKNAAAGSCAHDRARRLTWAQLLARTYSVDILRCARCGGRRELLAVVEDPAAIRKILIHLGLGQPSGSPRGPPPTMLGLL